MTLTLYRRHLHGCEAGRPQDTRSTERDERQKGWGRKCACPIYVSGTLGGRFGRTSTFTPDWARAQSLAASYQQAQVWTRPSRTPSTPAADPPSEAPRPARAAVALVDACTLFVSHREAAGLAPATLKKYRTFTKQLRTFAATRGYRHVDQFTPDDVDLFWINWKLGPRTKGKRLTTLRGFFRFCVHRKWIAESPVSPDLKPPQGASRAANKMPFTDEELKRIAEACDTVQVEWKNETGTGRWTGEDLKDLIGVMVYTGLRISDATLFDSARLLGNQVFLRATKNGGDVFAYVPDWLRDRLVARAARCGPRLFIPGHSTRLETVTNVWRRRLAKVFALAGPFDAPATPHRFRHTFARILLQNGVPVADVADLLGDEEKTVRRHYARWVPERQARLTRILQEAFTDTPKLTSPTEHACDGSACEPETRPLARQQGDRRPTFAASIAAA